MRERPGRSPRFPRTQYLAVAFVPALVVVMSITGFVWSHKSVTVVEDGNAKRVSTQAADVAGLLRGLDVALRDGDVVSPQPASQLEDGATVVVMHATPVTLRLGDETIDLDVVGNTVSDVLVAAGLEPSENPAVEPPLDTPLAAGMQVKVPEAFFRVVEEETPVPFKTITRSDPTLVKGSRSVVVAGVEGRVRRVYRLLVSNGVEGQRTLTSEQVLVKSVDEVVAVGSAPTAQSAQRRARAAARTAKAPKAGQRLVVTATGYAPGSDGVDWRTATGGRAGYGVIAVDPAVIPLGTAIFVPGYGYGIASDTGGAIDGKKIDLCFETRAEALVWGRRTVDVVVLN